MNDQENTIEKIKQTALDEFFMHGYNKASLRIICSRAGVTTGAMYFYFKNKEALFREIFEPLVVQYEELLVGGHSGEGAGKLLLNVPFQGRTTDGAVDIYIL